MQIYHNSVGHKFRWSCLCSLVWVSQDQNQFASLTLLWHNTIASSCRDEVSFSLLMVSGSLSAFKAYLPTYSNCSSYLPTFKPGGCMILCHAFRLSLLRHLFCLLLRKFSTFKGFSDYLVPK
jgi:hypothetical protein